MHPVEKGKYIGLISSKLENKFIIEKSFDKLEEAAQDLIDAHKNVAKYRYNQNILKSLENNLKREYDILERELQSHIEKAEKSEDPKLVEVNPTKVSIENRELGSGTVYLQYKEYEKTRSEIKREDYETDEEYYAARREETPGKLYNQINILNGGWIECTNRLPSSARKEATIDLYPPSSVERIYYSKNKE